MAEKHRIRMSSESSTGSSDSYCLDGSGHYAVIHVDSDAALLPAKTKTAHTPGRSLAVASLIISVFCLLAVVACGGAIVYSHVINSSSEAATESSDNEQVCMPCSQVRPNPLAESDSPVLHQLDIHFDDDGETEICCARTPAQYAALFKLILTRQEEVQQLANMLGSHDDDGDENNDDIASDVTGRNAVSAHLLSKPMSPQFLDENKQAIQQWKSPLESTLSHVRQGLKFHDNKIYVQSSGMYFIYCQILYNRADSDSEPHPPLASSYVKRHSVLYPASSGILLKARHTRASGEDDRHSSFVGGLFFLHAGDQLFVHVSVPELVSHDDKASFFGLFQKYDYRRWRRSRKRK